MAWRGAYVTIDGLDASGKTTAIARLSAETNSVNFKEPGGTRLGLKIRALLLDNMLESDEMTAEAEVLLFSADRSVAAPYIRGVINDPIQPRSLVSDRSVISTLAYQCYGRESGITVSEVMAITRFAMKDLVPDLRLIIDIDAETCMERLAGTNPDRIESSGIEYMRLVRAGFLRVANEFDIPVIEGSGTRQEVYDDVYRHCGELLLNGVEEV